MPNQLTESISPWINNARVPAWHALFAQEQWTLGRLTLQGALRFDRASSWFPEQQVGPSRFLPVAITFPETEGVDSYKDITPRMGVAYDVFGNGKTAVKFNVGKYLEGVGRAAQLRQPESHAAAAPLDESVRTAGRDADLDRRERQFPARLRSAEPARQRSPQQRRRLLRADLESELRAEDPDRQLSIRRSSTDGASVPRTGASALSVQQQLLPRMSVEVAYHRRWFNGFTRERQPVGASRPTTRRTASRRPRIPGCRTAAAT